MTRMESATDRNFGIWEDGLAEEIAFWRYWINEKEIPWQEDRRKRLDPTTPVQDWVKHLVPAEPGATVSLLDVGAGLATDLGKVWPGRTILIIAVDPLANEYNQLLDEARIIPPVRTRWCHGERLAKQFKPNAFDLVCARNSLDHSYDPLAAISAMLEVTKPNCWVKLTHFVNEAEFESYQGLHRWNFCLEGGEFLIWSEQQRIVVREHLRAAAEMQCWLAPGRVENGRLEVRIRKSGYMGGGGVSE